jgi:hypothetical protein
MINSTITPITTYTLSTIKIPKGALDNIDQARKQCLPRCNDPTTKQGNLVAWPNVMKPNDKRGLGVINLWLQNDAVLMKHLQKFYNIADVPWVRLI